MVIFWLHGSVVTYERGSSPPKRGGSHPKRGSSHSEAWSSPPKRGSSPPKRGVSPPKCGGSPPKHGSLPPKMLQTIKREQVCEWTCFTSGYSKERSFVYSNVSLTGICKDSTRSGSCRQANRNSSNDFNFIKPRSQDPIPIFTSPVVGSISKKPKRITSSNIVRIMAAFNPRTASADCLQYHINMI